MHVRPHKIDRAATKQAHFLSRYSYVSLRIHPGTDHACVYLAGADCEVARDRALQRDKFRCQNDNCQKCLTRETAEVDHIEGKRKVVRCWCDENLKTLCYRCHRRKHNRDVQLRDLRREAGELKKCPKHPNAAPFEGALCPACRAELEFMELYP